MNSTSDWLVANRTTLATALARVRARLEMRAGQVASPVADSPDDELAAPVPPDSALGLVRDIFGLTPFETDVLVLCAGAEVDSGIAVLCATTSGDPARTEPTFSLALAALSGSHWSAIAPDAPLRRWRLITPAPGPALTRAPLRVDERILHFLFGLDTADTRLAGLLTRLPAATEPLAGSHERIASRLAGSWSTGPAGSPSVPVHVHGDPAAGRDIAARAAALIGGTPRVLDARAVPADPSERDEMITLLNRDTLLGGGPLLILVRDDAENVNPAWCESLFGPVAVVSNTRLDLPGVVMLDVTPLPAAEQMQIWSAELGDSGSVALPAVVSQFSLPAQAIMAAAAEAARTGGADAAWDAARSRARDGLDGLAIRIPGSAGWDDLVVPADTADLLRALKSQVVHRHTVFEEWGLQTGMRRGFGVSALFAGPSGTGKTLAAEVLASELRLDLYIVDISQLVSKYIGETEKNLRKVFNAASSGGCVLLFDEADALFGKRSQVKDSHDRYANIEVSYLLQLMESYRGLAILTTNLRENLDRAFLRRLNFVITFPLPDAAERERIWRRLMPATMPTADVRHDQLARLAVPGGVIRNIVLSAAFRAAEDGGPLGMKHLLAAAHQECTKLERPVSSAEIGGWV